MAPAIVGCVLLLGALPVSSASPPSDWPSLSNDAAQSNFNSVERALTVKNVLKLKVKWGSPTASQSYPIVYQGRVYIPVIYRKVIHVRILAAGSGTKIGVISHDATGGLLGANDEIFVAGKSLRVVNSSTLQPVASVKGASTTANSTYAYPQSDGTRLFVGYTWKKGSSIYTIDPTTDQIVHKLSSASGVGSSNGQRIFTNTSAGGVIYSEETGKVASKPPYAGSFWFADPPLAYTVASSGQKSARVYAVDGSGHTVWSRVVGPNLQTQNAEWPHAANSTDLYVATLSPRTGIQALDPLTGRVLWTRNIAGVQSIALADNVLFAVTYSLGQDVQLALFRANTGKPLGAIQLSSGFLSFTSPNQLMVAAGMVFIRVVGPGGTELVALGLRSG